MAEGVSFGLAALIVGALLVVAERRELARTAVESWLAAEGLPSEFEFERLDGGGAVGSLRIGPADDPDLVVDRMELIGGVTAPWTGGAFGFEPTAVRLQGVRLRAAFDGRRISFGRLDPLIDRALSGPPSDGPSPSILIQDAVLNLATPAGPLRLSGAAGVVDEQLRWLDARAAPAVLRHADASARLAGALLSLRTSGEQVRVSASAQFADARAQAGSASDAGLRLTGSLPYPDSRTLAVNGPADLLLQASARSAALGDSRLSSVTSRTQFAGDLQGSASRLAFSGRAEGRGSIASVFSGDLAAQTVTWRADLGSLAVSTDGDGLSTRLAGSAAMTAERQAGAGVESRALRARLVTSGMTAALDAGEIRSAGPVRLDVSAAALRVGDVSADALEGRIATDARLLTGARTAFRGAVRASAAGGAGWRLQQVAADAAGEARLGDAPAVRAAVSASASGAAGPQEARNFAAAVPILGEQPAYAEALRRAASGWRATGAFQVSADAQGVEVAATEPLRAVSGSGAVAAFTPAAGGLLLRTSDGATRIGGGRLTVSGGGLPELDLVASNVASAPSGASADVRLRTTVDVAPVEGLRLDASGRLSLTNGAFSFSLPGCVRAEAARVELGENDLTGISGRVCPDAGPLIRAANGGWRAQGRVEDAALTVPSLQLAVSDGRARFQLTNGAPADGRVQVEQAVLRDAAEPVRFEPAGLTAELTGVDGVWTGVGAALAREGRRIADLRVRLDLPAGSGELAFDTGPLTFAVEGLQPGDLSPLAADLIRNAAGEGAFAGRLAWTREGVTSGGVLDVRGLDFVSPLGAVSGLRGEVRFTSLAPFDTPPDQRLTADRIASVLPLTGVAAGVQIRDEALRLADGSATAGGGRLVLETAVVPFAGGETSGTVRLDGVNVGAVFEATGLADRVQIDAPVSGRVPFTFVDGRLRLPGAMLASDRPGRISIQRSALSGLDASGGPQTPLGEVNAVQDFAYQALENLAYRDLILTLSTTDAGRLEMRFVVQGSFDPPQEQEARVPLFDLLRGTAFQRRIPLPSGTGVNLTLDTSLNLDELLAAWAQLQGSAARSGAVQSAPGTTPPTTEVDQP